MDRKEIINMVINQVISMLSYKFKENNEEDREEFLGWIEDGDAYYYLCNDDNITDECFKLSCNIAPLVDEMYNKFVEYLNK